MLILSLFLLFTQSEFELFEIFPGKGRIAKPAYIKKHAGFIFQSYNVTGYMSFFKIRKQIRPAKVYYFYKDENMFKNATLRTIILIWLGWFIVLYGFQWLVTTRLEIGRPDYAVSWTESETKKFSNKGKVYLLEPFMNRQVAWDSEYYVGIAVGGYDDPAAGKAETADGQEHIKNYSFFPLYPYLMMALAFPLKVFGMNLIATATLAGSIIALLGTLAGMLALYDITKDTFDEDGVLRTVIYMLIFPTGFFLAQIYTEGLFIGLAFWSLALMRRRQLVWAGVLAVFAAWTRAHGAALALPLLASWLLMIDWKRPFKEQFSWKWLALGLTALMPLVAYLVWRNSPLGQGWAAMQPGYFGRGLLQFKESIQSWFGVFEYASGVKQSKIYYGFEVFSILLAFVSGLVLLKKFPQVALFSLAVVILSVFSGIGAAQSQARYMLVAPAMFIVLSDLGKNKVFDRTWTLASILLMGMSVMLYSFDMWVG
jgi:hypothetical protein